MKSSYWFALAAVYVVPACSIYTQDLIDGAEGGVDDGNGPPSNSSGGESNPSTGGKSSQSAGDGGKANEGTGGSETDGDGGSDASGGSTASDGGAPSDGGTDSGGQDGSGGEESTGGAASGGEGSGGDDSSGGAPSGGAGSGGAASGGAGSGGAASGGAGSGGAASGGAGSGGAASGGAGSGGAPANIYCQGLCIDDMNHVPDTGSWIDPDGVAQGFEWATADDGNSNGAWTAPVLPNFTSERLDHPDPDPTNERVLRVSNDGFSTWGFDVYLVLDINTQDNYFDLTTPTAYTGVRFWAKAGIGTFKDLFLAVEDSGSSGTINHPRLVTPIVLTEDWAVYEVPFDNFSSPTFIKLDEVYGIHVTMSPGTTPVDFMVDDLSFYE